MLANESVKTTVYNVTPDINIIVDLSSFYKEHDPSERRAVPMWLNSPEQLFKIALGMISIAQTHGTSLLDIFVSSRIEFLNQNEMHHAKTLIWKMYHLLYYPLTIQLSSFGLTVNDVVLKHIHEQVVNEWRTGYVIFTFAAA